MVSSSANSEKPFEHMTIHKEGYASLAITLVVSLALNLLALQFLEDYPFIGTCILIVTIALFLIVLPIFFVTASTKSYFE